ncbi:hypothetical protein I601_1740 [Nocardioides dokdonensis FR1436]|uniref:DUF4395 domain-containing protein n=1 Tax=Nocardioides dokdonensis FR1436 TaxID=1300347 RepID=A0A1A9GL31_9ACTN|nr:DUF4395 domain-containing protein [Nocardioides dokdonensis]ANH38171.1 hypothetical protein I601_1740 [Nocardioides dokdonensis FR1436]
MSSTLAQHTPATTARATSAPAATAAPRTGIDPRGPQFAAGATALVLIAVLGLPPTAALALTAVQAALFALGAARGVQKTPHAWAFRRFIRPRLAAPTELEDPAPPRFAQSVGLLFTVVALVGYAAGLTVLAQVAIGFALVAATLNAVFRFCLGCELFLLVKRATA